QEEISHFTADSPEFSAEYHAHCDICISNITWRKTACFSDHYGIRLIGMQGQDLITLIAELSLEYCYNFFNIAPLIKISWSEIADKITQHHRE
ncbi:hypothetical protein ACJX0J_014234, partial [Zea mays]